MEKLVLGFIADILYVKGILSLVEYQDIIEVKNPSDLDTIIDKMLGGEYDEKRLQGEGYAKSAIHAIPIVD